jgi:UDP-N-acetylglucosamine acyltransferase
MNNIHPSAAVSNKAKLGDNITIDRYAIIHDDVEIGDNTYIGPFAVIYKGARIGKKVKIYQSASISHIPQIIGVDDEDYLCTIGDGSILHEFVTVHRGSKSTGLTSVGKNCLLMAYSHVGHDTKMGDNCVIANAVQIGGHCILEDYVMIGGLTPVHQFCRVGQHSMTGGGFRITQDVPPYILTGHHPLQYSGVNLIGLRRRGFKNDDMEILKKVYSFIYDKSLNVSQAKEKIKKEIGEENIYVKNVLEFLNNSKRGIVGK